MSCFHDKDRTTHEGQEWCSKCEKPIIKDLAYLLAALVVILAAALFSGPCTPAHAEVDLNAIAQIESSNRPHVIGDDGKSFGMYQLSAPVIKEYGFTVKEVLDNPSKQNLVARWYLNVRIPQMIRHYGKPVTVKNQIIAYNAGISYVKTGKPLPKVTRDYLHKYAVLTGGAL